MPFAAISYRVREGHDDVLAGIFSPDRFQRVDSPVLRDAQGGVLGYLTATGLFLERDTVVRVIQHQGGGTGDIARHMARQQGVREAERALVPYLAEPRDTETEQGFIAHFTRSLLLELEQGTLDDRPMAAVVALRYPTPGVEPARVREALAARDIPPLPLREGEIVGTGLFLSPGGFVLRVVQHEGDEKEILGLLGAHAGGRGVDGWLDPLLPEGTTRTVAPMKQVSLLSAAAGPPPGAGDVVASATEHADDVDARLDAVFERMAAMIDPDGVREDSAVFQFDVATPQAVKPYVLEVSGARRTARRGNAGEPDATIRIALPDILAMAEGTLTGEQAFLTGKLTLSGNPVYGMKLGQWLRHR